MYLHLLNNFTMTSLFISLFFSFSHTRDVSFIFSFFFLSFFISFFFFLRSVDLDDNRQSSEEFSLFNWKSFRTNRFARLNLLLLFFFSFLFLFFSLLVFLFPLSRHVVIEGERGVARGMARGERKKKGRIRSCGSVTREH